MTSTANVSSSHAVSAGTQNIVQEINALSTDEKLALLYFIYEKMGDSITPAAPIAAEPELAPLLLENFYELSDEEQLAAMRSIANCENTEYSRACQQLTVKL